MRIYAFTPTYPNVYKPYFDTQFVDLVRQGHDLTIVTADVVEPAVGDAHPLLRRRIHQSIPNELRAVVFQMPLLVRRLIASPVGALRRGLTAFSKEPDLRKAVRAAAQATSLPADPPDLCIVHGHGTLALFERLNRVYPTASIALYYYGGIPSEAGGESYEGLPALLGSVDSVFTCSSFAKSELVRFGGDEAPGIHVLPLSFDLAEWPDPVTREYGTNGVLNLLSVGRLSKGKGIEIALRALAEARASGFLAKVEYLIVGDGPERQRLEALATSLNLEGSVKFLGARPNQQVRTLYSSADALILPSYSTPRWTETQGTVVQEAMLNGALVITTETGGVTEWIPDEMRQFSVPERDSTALSEAIRELAALGPAELRAKGRMVSRWVRERFDVRDFNAQLIEIAMAARDGGSGYGGQVSDFGTGP